MYNPPPPSEPSEAAQKWAAEAPLLMDMLRDIAEMGTQLTRRAFTTAIQEDDARQEQPAPETPAAPPPTPGKQTDFERYATSVRRTVALIRRCAEPLEAPRAPSAPNPPTDRATKRNGRPEHGPLYEEIWDRPDRPEKPEWPEVFDFDHLIDLTAKWPCRKLSDKQLYLFVCREQGIYPPLDANGKFLALPAFDAHIKALHKARTEAAAAADNPPLAPETSPPETGLPETDPPEKAPPGD